MKYKFGDLVHYKPLYRDNDPLNLQIIGFDEKKQKYICMDYDLGYPYEVLTVWLCREDDLEYLNEVADINEYTFDGEILFPNPNIDLYYYEVYEPVGKEQIKVRNAVRRRKPFDVPLKNQDKKKNN